MIWKTIPGFPAYEISEIGQVRRGNTNNAGYLNKEGYREYRLFDGTRRRGQKFLAHRLVALTFHGPAPEGKPIVAHRNGIRRCNHYSNVYWASFQENSDDMKRHGTQTKGLECHSAKLTEEQVREIRASPEYITTLAAKYGVNNVMISKIKRRVSWKHVA